MATELVQINFHGDTLDCVQDSGKVWFSLRRGCENLGLDFSRQLQKLRSKSWATVGEMPTVGADGKDRVLACIDLDTLPGWLFSIDARKVNEHVREKLARYQKEAAKVLADHFLRKPPSPEPSALLTAILARIEAMEARQAALSALPPVHIPTPATPRFTVQERLRFKGWNGTSKKQRAQVRRLANTLLDLRHGETPDAWAGETGGGPCVYFAHQLAVLDEAIDRVRAEYQKHDARRGPGLYDAA